jgi:hypothetical protein
MPFAECFWQVPRPLHRRRSFDAKEHGSKRDASDIRSTRVVSAAAPRGVASYRNQPADDSLDKPSCKAIRRGLVRGGPEVPDIGQLEVI